MRSYYCKPQPEHKQITGDRPAESKNDRQLWHQRQIFPIPKEAAMVRVDRQYNI
jgi:hypothetical protein